MRTVAHYFMFALSVVVVCCTHELTEVLSMKDGQIQGLWSNTTKGQPMRAFYSIPYAQPPLGNLRFKVNYNNFKKRVKYIEKTLFAF